MHLSKNDETKNSSVALQKANEILYDLYNFKVKAREINLKMQSDMKTFKLYTDTHTLKELKVKNEEYIKGILTTFNDLKLKFKEVSAVIAAVRKLSNPNDSITNNTDLSKQEICIKLQELTNAVFCKWVYVKWTYTNLKTELAKENTKRETIARLIYEHLKKETVVPPASIQKENHGSSTKTQPLSEAISEMNNMIRKLSFPNTDEVPSKDRIHISVPTNAPIETKSQFLGTQINSKTDGFVDNTTSNNLGSNTPKTAKAFESIGSFKFVLPKSSPTQSKAQSSENATSIRNVAPLIDTPAKASESIGSFKFSLPISSPSKLKAASGHNTTSQATRSLPNIFRVTQFSGTTILKFRQLIEYDQVERDGVTSHIKNFYSCLTMLPEYENKSLEELRLEDYFLFGVFGNQNNQTPFNQPIHVREKHYNKDFKVLDALRVKFQPTCDVEWRPVKNGKADQFQSITLMKDFNNRSFEELRLSDYMFARVFTPGVYNADGMGTACVGFFPPIETIEEYTAMGPVRKVNVKHHFITTMKEFQNKSFEELRLEDYLAGRRNPTPVEFQRINYFKNINSDGMGTARAKFIPVISNEKFPSIGNKTIELTTRHQCITDMKEYENKSLEELRLEDYLAGRKGPSTKVGIYQSNKSQNIDPDYFTSKTQTLGSARNTPETRETPKQYPNEASAQRRGTPKEESNKLYRDKSPKLEHGVSDENKTESENETEEAIKTGTIDCDKADDLIVRARTYYESKKYREALDDAKKAERLSSNLPAIGYLTIAKCCLALGQIAPGEQAVRRAAERDPAVEVEELNNAFEQLRIKQERIHRHITQNNYYDAVLLIDHCLQRYCPASSTMKLLKAECYAHMRKYDQARSMVIDLSRVNAKTQSCDAVYADVLYVTGLCSYYQENDEQAMKHFRKVLENDPDHEKAIKMFKLTKSRMNTKLIQNKKEQGNKAFTAGEWQKAMRLYDEALSIDKNNKDENAKLHFNRAKVFAKLNQPMKAISACNAALELNENYTRALLKRAETYRILEKYEESLDDYEKLYYFESTEQNKYLLDEAISREKANRGPYYYYKALEIKQTVSQDEIKKAYRRCALRYHPDKHASAAPAELRQNERKFKLMKEAYDTLRDPRARHNYDRAQATYHNNINKKK